MLCSICVLQLSKCPWIVYKVFEEIKAMTHDPITFNVNGFHSWCARDIILNPRM